jgi:uncharacterized protein (TIGR00251 family)
VIRQTATGVDIDVRVVPRAARSEIAGTRDGRLLVRLSAPPVEGAANAALIVFVADRLGVPKRSIQIISGEKSRSKRIAVAGADAEEVRRLLGV